MNDDQNTKSVEPAEAPGRVAVPVENRIGDDVASGRNHFISWGCRSDVGLVRTHNEDSFLVRTPLFVVSDGMGGHAAGEVASSIAVETIGTRAPAEPDDILLGAAVEEANRAVIKGAAEGRGKPGMGCTASAVLIKGDRMAIAHVGDSRVYLLHEGRLVRVTHDHSFVEELVDAGQITEDEARVHPSRSVITRALGSDPDMYSDHFTLDVRNGDRVILCSDGLSSIVADHEIELLAVSSASPQAAADKLVSAALTAGGADNVTVLVIDILNDGIAEAARRRLMQRIGIFAAGVAVALLAVSALFIAFVKSEWYLAPNGETVGIYQGIHADVAGLPLYELIEPTTILIKDLPDAVQVQLERGIQVSSEEEARAIVESYRDQIDAEKTRAAEKAEEAKSDGDPTGATVTPSDEAPEGEAAAGANAAQNAGQTPDGTPAEDDGGGE
ncbi:Stp1/IreP family PP2C-type Ser/Thr phosphatase [Coriobacteriales bacterium OH1046]|nr:Stp1/IreP family PP2C-type Ser/Thr phosphatase [Coriobacteriales bacterium OH1046]